MTPEECSHPQDKLVVVTDLNEVQCGICGAVIE